MSHPVNAGYSADGRWFVCDRCGFDYRVKEARKEYTGLVVCPSCFDTRHPQEFLQVKQEQPATEPIRPPPTTDTFTDVTFSVIGDSDQAIPGATHGGSSQL